MAAGFKLLTSFDDTVSSFTTVSSISPAEVLHVFQQNQVLGSSINCQNSP